VAEYNIYDTAVCNKYQGIYSYEQLTKFYIKFDLNFAVFVHEIVGYYQR
jgi:hypothetical protein